MASSTKKPQHVNPFSAHHDSEAHALFEHAWAKKTTFGNFKGLWESGRKQREARVEQRVKTFMSQRDAFVASPDLALKPSYHPERDGVNHPYTGLRGKGEPVLYLNRNKPEERNQFAVNFQGGRLQEDGIKKPGGHDMRRKESISAPDSDNLRGDKIMFTRRESNAGSLLAMVKETKPLRSQHSTFNAGLPVANAGFINMDNAGRVQNFKLASGHYAPNEASGIKLAMWSERHGVFNEGRANIIDHSDKVVDTSMPARMFAVQQWHNARNK